MECAEIREEFSALLDGELCQEARAAVETHLAQCAACLRELDKFKRVDALYRDLPRQTVPADFDRRLQAALSTPVVRFEPGRARAARLWPVLAAAALFLLVVGGVLMQSGLQSQRFRMSSVANQGQETIREEAAAQRLSPQAAADVPESEKEQLNALGYLTPKGKTESGPGAGAGAGAQTMPAPPPIPAQAEEQPVRTEEKTAAVKPKLKEAGQNTPAKPVQARKASQKSKAETSKKRAAALQEEASAPDSKAKPESKPVPTASAREDRFEIAAAPKPNVPTIEPESASAQRAKSAPSPASIPAPEAKPEPKPEIPASEPDEQAGVATGSEPSAPLVAHETAPAAESETRASKPLRKGLILGTAQSQTAPKSSGQPKSPAPKEEAKYRSGGYGAFLDSRSQEGKPDARKSTTSDTELSQAYIESKEMPPPAAVAPPMVAASPPKPESAPVQVAPPPPPPAALMRAAPEPAAEPAVPKQAKEDGKPLAAETPAPSAQSNEAPSQTAQPKPVDTAAQVARLRQEVEQHPGDTAARLKLAQALHQQGKDKEAIRCLREALRIDPKCTDAYIALGNLYAAQGRTNKAQEQFKQALALDPNNPRAQQALERIKAQQTR